MQIPPPVHVWSKTSIYSFMVMKYVELEDVSFCAKDQGFVFCPATAKYKALNSSIILKINKRVNFA